MFDKKVRTFITHAFKTCHNGQPPKKSKSKQPTSFQVVSLNPSTFSSRNGMQILQFLKPFQISKLIVNTKQDKGNDNGVNAAVWNIRTINVRRFSLLKSYISSRKNTFVIDNNPIVLELDYTKHHSTTDGTREDEDVFHFVRHNNTWTTMKTLNENNSLSKTMYSKERHPGTTGPMRQVFDKPFAIIVNDTSTLSLGVLLSNSHYIASKTTAPIYYAHNIPNDVKNNYNLIFIGSSMVRDEIFQLNLNVKFEQNSNGSGFQFHHCSFEQGDHAGIVFLAPTFNVQNPDQLVLIIDATDRDALVDLFRGSYSSNQPLTRAMFTNMYPDFFITNKDFRWKGYGGVSMSGYYNYNWEWDDTMSVQSDYCRRVLYK